MAQNGITINPEAILIVNSSRVVGGKKSERSVTSDRKSGAGRIIDAETRLTIDDVAERKRGEALKGEIDHRVRQACQQTPIGTLIGKGNLPSLVSKLETIGERVAEFNRVAHTCRVELSVIPVEISVTLGSEAAKAIARHVREELESLRESFRAGDASKIRAWQLRADRLAECGVGPLADVIVYAIDRARSALTELKGAIGRGESPESAGRSLDLGELDNAIDCWTLPGEGTPALPA